MFFSGLFFCFFETEDDPKHENRKERKINTHHKNNPNGARFAARE
jgi:hypothetical protein